MTKLMKDNDKKQFFKAKQSEDSIGLAVESEENLEKFLFYYLSN